MIPREPCQLIANVAIPSGRLFLILLFSFIASSHDTSQQLNGVSDQPRPEGPSVGIAGQTGSIVRNRNDPAISNRVLAAPSCESVLRGARPRYRHTAGCFQLEKFLHRSLAIATSLVYVRVQE